MDAASYTVPVSRSAAEQIKSLRQSASGKFLSASAPGIYQWDENSVTPYAHIGESACAELQALVGPFSRALAKELMPWALARQ